MLTSIARQGSQGSNSVLEFKYIPVALPQGMGGSRSTPTNVQTPLEISTKLLKTAFVDIAVGIPCMYIVTFSVYQQRKLSWTPNFLNC